MARTQKQNEGSTPRVRCFAGRWDVDMLGGECGFNSLMDWNKWRDENGGGSKGYLFLLPVAHVLFFFF